MVLFKYIKAARLHPADKADGLDDSFWSPAYLHGLLVFCQSKHLSAFCGAAAGAADPGIRLLDFLAADAAKGNGTYAHSGRGRYSGVGSIFFRLPPFFPAKGSSCRRIPDPALLLETLPDPYCATCRTADSQPPFFKSAPQRRESAHPS